MPRLLVARAARDEEEARCVQKLARSHHAPADWVFHAQMVVASWSGQRTRVIAVALHCHPQTVRERLTAFNERGVDGLGMRPGSGRRARLTQTERSRILALVRQPPPGKLVRDRDSGELHADDPEQPGEWTLNTLTAAAQAHGIQVARSQVRRIVLREGMRWRHTRSWATSQDPDFVAKERRS
jgi:transposase